VSEGLPNGQNSGFRYRVVAASCSASLRLALVVAAVVAMAPGSTVRAQAPEESQQNRAATQKPSENNSPVIRLLIPPKTEEERAREAKERAEKEKIDRQIVDLTGNLAFYTELLFAATAVLAVLTGGLVLVGFRQVRDARETIAAAKASAEAAKDSAAALPRVERAYVFVKIRAGSIGYYGRNGKDFGYTYVKVLFFNRGKTPALMKKIRAVPLIQESAPEKLPALSETDKELPPGYIISADGNFEMKDIEVVREMVEMAAVENGTKTLFIAGLVEYDDVLGESRETGFCWQYDQGQDGLFRPSHSNLNYHR
jgi:hypothetical protein